MVVVARAAGVDRFAAAMTARREHQQDDDTKRKAECPVIACWPPGRIFSLCSLGRRRHGLGGRGLHQSR